MTTYIKNAVNLDKVIARKYWNYSRWHNNNARL